MVNYDNTEQQQQPHDGSGRAVVDAVRVSDNVAALQSELRHAHRIIHELCLRSKVCRLACIDNW
jgi:hypothetical protein